MKRKHENFLDLFERILENKSDQAKKKIQMLKQHEAFREWIKAYRAEVQEKLDAS